MSHNVTGFPEFRGLSNEEVLATQSTASSYVEYIRIFVELASREAKEPIEVVLGGINVSFEASNGNILPSEGVHRNVLRLIPFEEQKEKATELLIEGRLNNIRAGLSHEEVKNDEAVDVEEEGRNKTTIINLYNMPKEYIVSRIERMLDEEAWQAKDRKEWERDENVLPVYSKCDLVQTARVALGLTREKAQELFDAELKKEAESVEDDFGFNMSAASAKRGSEKKRTEIQGIETFNPNGKNIPPYAKALKRHAQEKGETLIADALGKVTRLGLPNDKLFSKAWKEFEENNQSKAPESEISNSVDMGMIESHSVVAAR